MTASGNGRAIGPRRSLRLPGRLQCLGWPAVICLHNLCNVVASTTDL